MRTLNINQVKENDILDQNIHSITGATLVAKGVKLKTKIIERLKEMGYRTIAIRDERFKDMDIAPHQALSDETRYKALSVTKSVLENYARFNRLEGVHEVSDVVDDILYEVQTNNEIGLDISSVQNYDLGTFTHSLSVTVLSLYLAKEIGLNKKQLKDIGIGGLLHDLGKLNIPQEILNKPGRLTEEEFEIVKKHPMDGFMSIKGKINLLAAHIALQHHEKYDGTGYPRQLKGNDIHLYGRLTAICDVYDAITMDRPYRPGMNPKQAIDLMLHNAGTHFDPELLKSFINIISPYPNGSIVLLNNEDKAIVTGQNRGFPLRPLLMVFERGGKGLKEYIELDLCKELDLSIIGFENRDE